MSKNRTQQFTRTEQKNAKIITRPVIEKVSSMYILFASIVALDTESLCAMTYDATVLEYPIPKKRRMHEDLQFLLFSESTVSRPSDRSCLNRKASGPEAFTSCAGSMTCVQEQLKAL
jgi:hypothetical protein